MTHLAYTPLDTWAQLPDDQTLEDVAGVAVDAQDRVYAFDRGPHPISVFAPDGRLLDRWGHPVLTSAHALSIGPDDSLWCTDVFGHAVHKFSLDGRLLLTLGTPGQPAPRYSGQPFCLCTHTAHAPNGDVLVSDGYGNARVHRFDPAGRHLMSFGEPGLGPGQFMQPHNICCDAEGLIHVADREAHRVQVFDPQGRFIRQTHGLHRPSGMALGAGPCPLCFVTEMAPIPGGAPHCPNIGPRISILDHEGRILGRIGTEPALGTGPGQFIAPHGIAVDSRGDLYVAELARTNWPRVSAPGTPFPRGFCGIRKIVRTA